MSVEDFSFKSDVNYQKIFLNDNVTVSTSTFPVTTTITHSLGYKPNVKVWLLNSSGALVPAIGVRSIIATLEFPTDGIVTLLSDRYCNYQITDTTLVIKVYSTSTQSVKVYYRIYLDEAE